jgi:hypothetical protein
MNNSPFIMLLFTDERNRRSVLLPKKDQFKISDSCVDHGDYAHPLGCLSLSSGRLADTATAQGIGGV